MIRTRPPALAGSWYPGSPSTLANEVDSYLAGADPAALTAGRPLLAVVPHAGYVFSGESAGRLYGLLRNTRPDTVFIMAPNHRSVLDSIALPGSPAFATPLGEVMVRTDAVNRLAACDAFIVDDSAHRLEHAIEIQLPFLQRLWPDSTPQIVPMLVPRLDTGQRTAAAAAITELLDPGNLPRGNTLILVSTDFTHYGSTFGYVPFTEDVPASLERLDAGAILKILAADPDELIAYGETTGITMCGLQAMALALAVGLPPGYEAGLVDYRRSGDRDGDYSLSVSYASILMTAGPEEPAHPGS